MKNSRTFSFIVLMSVLVIGALSASAQKPKSLFIQATAMGTSYQLGRTVSVDIRINDYSTAADRTALLQAFADKGSEGLANALDKMKSKGRVAMTGTLGFDVRFIRKIKMSDGSTKYRFVTDRPITFGELWSSSRSMDYNLAMGEIIISKDGKKKSGTLYPAAQLKLDKEKNLTIETFNNPWKLVNIMIR